MKVLYFKSLSNLRGSWAISWTFMLFSIVWVRSTFDPSGCFNSWRIALLTIFGVSSFEKVLMLWHVRSYPFGLKQGLPPLWTWKFEWFLKTLPWESLFVVGTNFFRSRSTFVLLVSSSDYWSFKSNSSLFFFSAAILAKSFLFREYLVGMIFSLTGQGKGLWSLAAEDYMNTFCFLANCSL